VNIRQHDRTGSTGTQNEPSPSADPSTPPTDPGGAEIRRQDRARRQIESGGIDDPVRMEAVGAGVDLTKSVPDRKLEQMGDDDAMTPQITAAKQRSAELLRDAVNLVAWRTISS
jgi:hypothetical protein